MGSVQTLACFGLRLALLVHCLSICILACLLRQKALLSLSPSFFLDSSRDPSVVYFWWFFWVFFHLNCFGLHSKEPTGAEGKTWTSKRKDTKTHQFLLLRGAHQHQKLSRLLSTFCLSCCMDFFLPFPETKGAATILSSSLCGWVGGVCSIKLFFFSFLCLLGILFC